MITTGTTILRCAVGNYTLRGFHELDPKEWAPAHAELMVWRHMVHMWDDGFTVDDGPLQTLEDLSNARAFVNLARQSRASGGLVNCHSPVAQPAETGHDGMAVEDSTFFMVDVRRERYGAHPVDL